MADPQNFMMSSDMEEAIVEKAQERFPDAWDLAVNTEDEELFEKVWKEATRLVLDDIMTSLIDKGILEAAGMTEDGDMSFSLTKLGDAVATRIQEEEGE